MPDFTQWNVPSPFPNILYNPAAVDAAIAKTQSELGNLDIERQKFGLERQKFDRGVTEGEGYIGGSLSGTAGTTGAAAGGGGSGPPDPNSPAGQVAHRTAAFWSGQGFTPEQVAGIMAGGPAAESSFNTGASGDGGTSYGLYQHHAGRMEELKKRYGPNPTEAQQHEFAAWEISPQGPLAAVGARLRQTKTPQEAADIWTRGFESPANVDVKAAQRAANAGRYLGYGLPTQAAAPVANPNAGPREARLLGNAPITTGRYAPTITSPVAPAAPADPAVATTPSAPMTTGQADPASMEAVKQASVALLAMPEAEAAVAYGPTVAALQARGLAMNAPPEYPGHAALQAIVGGGEPAPPPVEPSRQAMRLGGTDTAGPGAGQTTMPPVEQPNRLYSTGLAGVTINAPGNPLAPPVQTAAAPPAQAQAPAAAPPPAPSRAIQREPLLSNNLTASQQDAARRAIRAGTPLATVQAHVEQWKQENVAARHQDAVDAAAQQQQDYERRLKADETQYTRGRQAEIDQRSKDEAARHAEELAIKQAAEKRAADKEAADQKARIKGDAIAAQHENTLLDGTESGETNTAKYASAYSKFAEGRYNADGSFVKPNMTAYAKPTFIPPGATEVPDYGKQETPGPLPPPAVMTGMQGNVSGIKNINQVLRELDAHPNSVGMKALQGEWALQYTDPEGIALRAGIADILSQTFHDRSGASVTISESPRLKPFVPAPTDTVAALRTKLERLRGIYRDVLEDNYSVYGPEGTGRSLPIIERTLKQTPKASDKTDAATVKPPPKGSKVIIP